MEPEALALTLPIRRLVEFLLRTGSIDSRFTGFDRALEGARLHRKLQRAAVKEYPDYQAEATLKQDYACAQITYTLEGRADGIFTDIDGMPTIDEIKTTTLPPELITGEQSPEHWAQAQIYAAIYARQNGLPAKRERLPYFQVDEELEFRFSHDYTADALDAVVTDLLTQYAPWAKRAAEWQRISRASLAALQFPFPGYRPGQRAMIGAVYKICTEGGQLLCQAPTGIGKTMSVLFPALKAVKQGGPVFYLTARGTTRAAAVNALALLRALSEVEAVRLAEELKEFYDTLMDMTEQGTEAAKLQVESWYQKDKVLVVFLPECHESLAGIIAGRLREYYQKPAIVLTRGEEAVKGSGRSIDEYHMFKKLTEVSDLLLKFGGHPLAAGLSLEEKNIDEFRRRLNENAGLTEEDFKAKVWIDVPMPVGYVTERLVRELSCLEPFGQGNEKPLFAEKSLRIRASRVLGRNRNVVKMTLEETDGHAIEALYFGDGTAFEEERAGRREIDVVYYPDINEYNGRKTLQAVIRRYKFRG